MYRQNNFGDSLKEARQLFGAIAQKVSTIETMIQARLHYKDA
jgi:hypothetical protein